MDDSPNSGSRLEVSVSFGRFENDALSWEKWSSFSPNKYLEEVGSLSTPGSVAQKKAYFEAHYKRIAAKKAEEMEQEKSTGPVNRSLNVSSKGDCYANSFETDNEFKFGSSNCEELVKEIATLKTNISVYSEGEDDSSDGSNGFMDMINSYEGIEDASSVVKCESSNVEEIKDESSVGINEPEINVGKDYSEVKDNNNDGSNGFVDVINSDEEKEDVSGVLKCKSSKIVEIKDELDASIDEAELNVGKYSSEVKGNKNDRLDGFMDMIKLDEEKEDVSGVNRESSKIEEIKDESNVSIDEHDLIVVKKSVSVGLRTSRKDSKDSLEKGRERRNGGEKQKGVLKKENSKLTTPKISQEVTPTEKERKSVMIKKKIASPIGKPLQAAITRYSKPTLMTTPISASRDLKKKANMSRLPRSSNFSVEESKRCVPTSLHMSLSLGPTNSLGGLSTMRKSLIMESMGDKDIVKRAFKTFRNRTNGLTSDEKPSAVKHIPSTALKPKVSSSETPTKGNTGVRKDTEKTATPRSHPGTKSNPLPSGSHKISATSGKSTIASSPATSFKSDEKSERRKEFLKKLETKSIAREAANAQPSAKSKMGVAKEIHQRPTLGR
ncbi:hypothetical protein OROGR_003594 [Orobanche gracilis]